MPENKPKQPAASGSSFWSEAFDFVKVFVLTSIVILVFVNFIAHPIRVYGRSMYPNLQDGEYGFTSLISLRMSPPKRQDIVVVEVPDVNGKKDHWVKRVIGLPGETIACKDGVVTINGEPLDESAYLTDEYMKGCLLEWQLETGVDYGPFTYDFGPITLGENEYWLMGDNRPHSKDSRDPSVGPFQLDQLYGKGVFVLYPFSQAGFH